MKDDPTMAANTGNAPAEKAAAPEAVAKVLTPAAERALAEAAARRAARDAETAALPVEHGGQKGPDPARYGDWEKAGIVSDF
jgi:hypothetical protein